MTGSYHYGQSLQKTETNIYAAWSLCLTELPSTCKSIPQGPRLPTPFLMVGIRLALKIAIHASSILLFTTRRAFSNKR